LIGAACLGRLPHDRPTREIVLTPGGVTVDLPLHENHPHWLLRDLPRWCGAFEARWGGNEEDRALLTARAVRFRDAGAASHALGRLTPKYLGTIFRDRILDGPWPVEFPRALPGDEGTADEYALRIPPDENGLPMIGQYVAVRSGRAVILTESIGLGPDELASVVRAMVRMAAQAQGGC
jgi:hypothetical protein